MGKRNHGNGIIDRSYDKAGNPTGYRGKKPFRVYCHYPEWGQYSQSFPSYLEAEKWKLDQDTQYRNRHSIEFKRHRELEKLREYKLKHVFLEYIRECKTIGASDVLMLHKFCREALIANMSLAQPLEKHHAENYLNDLAETGTYRREGWIEEKKIKSTDVSRLRNILQTAFERAIRNNYFGVVIAPTKLIIHFEV